MHGELPPDGRFVQEAVAKTLGFPLRQLPTRAEGDSWQRMLNDPEFAAASFQFVAAMRRSLDVVLVTEHIDESLLLLGRRRASIPTALASTAAIAALISPHPRLVDHLLS